MRDSLGDRMKEYEASQTTVLPPVLPYVLRIDGKAFHTLTKKIGAKKPFDQDLRDYMNDAAKAVLQGSMGAKLAYVQSDEMSIVFVEDQYESQKWFGGTRRKIESVGASLATVGFNKSYLEKNGSIEHWASFDARVFYLPFHEVLNNLHWRVMDAERNSIQMLARTYFSHKQCDHKNTSMLQTMLFEEKGINWNSIDTQFKRGNIVTKNGVNNEIPRIKDERKWWEDLLFNDCVYWN